MSQRRVRGWSATGRHLGILRWAAKLIPPPRVSARQNQGAQALVLRRVHDFEIDVEIEYTTDKTSKTCSSGCSSVPLTTAEKLNASAGRAAILGVDV